MNRLQHIVKYGLFTIIWMGLIWVLSSQSVLNVGLTGFWDVLFKKFAHVFVYAILGLLLTKLLVGGRKWNKSRDRYNLAGLVLLAFLIGSLYAISDEIHQTFVPGRSGSLIDVGLDIIGLFFGLVWGIRLATHRLRTSVNVLLSR